MFSGENSQLTRGGFQGSVATTPMLIHISSIGNDTLLQSKFLGNVDNIHNQLSVFNQPVKAQYAFLLSTPHFIVFRVTLVVQVCQGRASSMDQSYLHAMERSSRQRRRGSRPPPCISTLLNLSSLAPPLFFLFHDAHLVFVYNPFYLRDMRCSCLRSS